MRNSQPSTTDQLLNLGMEITKVDPPTALWIGAIVSGECPEGLEEKARVRAVNLANKLGLYDAADLIERYH